MLSIEFRTMGSQARALLDAEGSRAQAALDRMPAWFAARERALSRFDPGAPSLGSTRRRTPSTSMNSLGGRRRGARRRRGDRRARHADDLSALEAAGYDRSFGELPRDRSGFLSRRIACRTFATSFETQRPAPSVFRRTSVSISAERRKGGRRTLPCARWRNSVLRSSISEAISRCVPHGARRGRSRSRIHVARIARSISCCSAEEASRPPGAISVAGGGRGGSSTTSSIRARARRRDRRPVRDGDRAERARRRDRRQARAPRRFVRGARVDRGARRSSRRSSCVRTASCSVAPGLHCTHGGKSHERDDG